jgi:acetyl esterase/lipase
VSASERPGRSLVAAIAASALLLAACGDDSDDSSASRSSEATLPGESVASVESVESVDQATPTDAGSMDDSEETTAAPPTAAPSTTASDGTAPDAAPTTSPSLWTVEPVAADVAYAPMSAAQTLDLYLPDAPMSPLPLVVFIHGGAWMAGDKRNEYAAGVVPLFLDEGYAVASINYRLSGEAIFPAQLLDVKAAIRWLRANAPTYGIDPDRIAATGESAGAHLAALLGTSAGVAEFDDPAYGNPGVSSAVNAVIDWYGPVDLVAADVMLAANPACTETLRSANEPDPASTQLLGAPPDEVPELAATANPITYLQPGRIVPPFLIEHGDVDCVVPYQGSVALHEAIEAFAGPGRSQLVIVPGSGHFMSFDAASQIPTVLAFLADTIGAASG